NLLTDRLRELETAGVLERRLGGDVNAVVYALTDWGAQLREPIEGLVRWSTPLMVRGPEGDRFHPDWLLVALPAVLAGRAPRDQSSTIGIAVDDAVVQVRATSTDVEVTMHDGRDLDAVLRADAQIVLGLAVGMLTLDIVQDLVDIQGDEAALVSALRL
ncbi:MAG: winged helix-turn-helix transcriptional regulator, partial [Candidatus Nanopelagicales bacterium]